MTVLSQSQRVQQSGVLKLGLKYRPHGGQVAFHAAPLLDPRIRFRCVAPGRRWGKTYAGATELIRRVTQEPRGAVSFVVAPSYSATSLGKCWRTILQFAPRVLLKERHKTPGNMYLRWIGNRLTYFRSAEAPESCEGEAVYDAWFDEPGKMKKGDVWDVAVMPSLMDTGGWAWFTGTPTPYAKWYKFLFDKGLDRQANPAYWSRGGSTYENTIEQGGYLQKAEVDAIAAKLSERSRKQNIYGEWLADMGCLFRRVQDHIVHEYDAEGRKREFSGWYSSPAGAKEGEVYAVAGDLAKHQDWTVCIALNEQGHVVGYDRFHQVDWPLQQKRLLNFARNWNDAHILVDSRGVGDSVFDGMRKEYPLVDGYNIKSNIAKTQLVENLSLMMENGQITYPNITELVSELGAFGFYTRESGVTVYEAPEGYHDDTVIALALAAWQIRRPAQLDVAFGKAKM